MRLKGFILSLFIFLLLLSGCSSNKDSANKDYDGQNPEEGKVTEVNSTVKDRKIIYKVSATIETKKLQDTLNLINSQLLEDEWIELENVYDTSANLVIRVKSDRLDTYLDAIFKGHDISNYRKSATDISLSYQEQSHLLLTYQKERERLLELYESASLSDMIVINQRLAEIDVKMAKLQGELNQYDSLVDYSEVTLSVYQLEDPLSNNKESYLDTLRDSIGMGWSSLLNFLKFISIVIVILIPWIILIIPIIIGLIFLNHTLKKHKQTKIRQNQIPQQTFNKDQKQ